MRPVPNPLSSRSPPPSWSSCLASCAHGRLPLERCLYLWRLLYIPLPFLCLLLLTFAVALLAAGLHIGVAGAGFAGFG